MKYRTNRRRKAISEIIASLIMIGITLVAGAGAFGFVNSQAGISANQVGQANANNINFLGEKFVISTSIVTGSTNTGTVYLYNNGVVDLTIKSILLVGKTSTGASLSIQFTDSASCGAAAKVYCYSDSNNPACNSYITSRGFTASPVQPESHTANVPLPVYTFTTANGCSGNLKAGNAYTLTFTGTFGNVVSASVTAG